MGSWGGMRALYGENMTMKPHASIKTPLFQGDLYLFWSSLTIPSVTQNSPQPQCVSTSSKEGGVTVPFSGEMPIGFASDKGTGRFCCGIKVFPKFKH